MPLSKIRQTILGLPRLLKKIVVMIFDSLICVFSVWLAFGLRADQWGLLQGNQLWALFMAIAFSFPLFFYFGLYRAIFRYVGSAALASMARVFISYAFLYFFIFSLIGMDGVPRSIGVIQPMLLFICIGVSRYFVRHWLGAVASTQRVTRRAKPVALIYGAGSSGRQLAAGLAINKELIIKGFIDDDPSLHGSTVNGISVYSHASLQDLIDRLDITDVLLALPSAGQERLSEIIASLNGCGVRVRKLPGINDIASGRVRISDLHDLDMNDLLGRAVVPPNIDLLEKNIRNQVVLVTGAGGSIGSELCRQIIKYTPKSLILIDSSEHSLYLIYEEIKKLLIEAAEGQSLKGGPLLPPDWSIALVPLLASVRDESLLQRIFRIHRPSTVFHAAAYKHVPLVEQNPAEGIRNNVFGTLTCAQISLEHGVSQFILVSTDKAVRPTNVMGASKRIAELVLQAIAEVAVNSGRLTNFSMVRFGNVLGSSGSVAPLFSAQIAAGGPITLTHADVTRYFMTIPEAAQLVIQASAMAQGGDVFVLDMGEPVRIYDLAIKMIYLSGLLVKDETHPHGDIEIQITGLRPGEKLYEELLIGDNPQLTAHPKIMKAHEDFLSWDELKKELEELNLALDAGDSDTIKDMLKILVPGYQPNDDAVVWRRGELS